MGLFHMFKKVENKIHLNKDLKIAIQQTCNNLTQYCRDANLPYEITHKYQRGMIVREQGSVDATALSGGIIKNHRYIILSNHMVPLLRLNGDKKMVYIADKNSRFLVLGKAKGNGKRVTVLLHLNKETWQLFKSIDMNILQSLTNEGYNAFKKCIFKEPIVSVSTDEWFERCKSPIGMNDKGDFFSIDDDNDTYTEENRDIFKPKACVSGIHEFTAFVSHENQCEPTLTKIHYVCKKCGVHYLGATPEKYGKVVEINKKEL